MTEIPTKPKKAEKLTSKIEEWRKTPIDPITSGLHGKKKYIKTVQGKDAEKKQISIYGYDNGTKQVLIEGANPEIFKSTTNKTLQYLKENLIFQHPWIKNKELTEQQIKQKGNIEVKIKPGNYQKRIGVNYNLAVKQLLSDIDALYWVSLEYVDTVYNKKKNKRQCLEAIRKVRIFTSQTIERHYGEVIVTFNNEFTAFLVNQPTFWLLLPDYYYKAKPVISQVLFKLCNHAHSNRKRDKKRGFSIIGVETLLEAVGNIPSYEKVMGKDDRHVQRRIIRPLEDALNDLQDKSILTWRYCNANGKLLNEGQPTREWEQYKNLYIRYNINKPIEIPPAR
jgi:hypothetical protein